MKQTIVEMLYVARDPAWAPWAVQYFFLIGLSVGAFLLSLPGLAFAQGKGEKPAQTRNQHADTKVEAPSRDETRILHAAVARTGVDLYA